MRCPKLPKPLGRGNRAARQRHSASRHGVHRGRWRRPSGVAGHWWL